LIDLPLLSIIIPSCNEEKFIGKCLDSIVANDFPKDRLKIFIVDAYDCNEWFKPVYEQFSIPWNYIDLNYFAITHKGPYDAILLCEVIEHLARWPAEVLSELRGSLML